MIDFVNNQNEFYNKTNNMFKNKVRKDCLWERFASNCNFSVKVCMQDLFEIEGLIKEI